MKILYSKIKGFLKKYPRSVVVLDDLNFSMQSMAKDRTLDFLRRLVDISTTSDDLAFIPINLDAFDTKSKLFSYLMKK